MTALQEKLKSAAEKNTEVSLDIPAFVQQIYAEPYAPPRNIPFSTPNEKGLDVSYSDNSLIIAGSEVRKLKVVNYCSHV